jgi:AraC-like DNA-binding protein
VKPDDDGLLLAKVAGDYREAPPTPALRSHFRCVWRHTTPAGPPLPIVVVPDGCVDLLWHEGGLFVAGPDVEAARPALPPGTTVIGLRFQPGAAVPWLRLPMTAIVGRQVELGSLWGRRASRLAHDIAIDDPPAAILARLQSGLVGQAPTSDPPRDMALVFRSLGRGAGEASATMPRLLERLELSERSLRRRCHEAFGYGPKRLDRILRFQRFLDLARRAPGAELAALALAAGYADQAHLSREVRRLSTLSAAAVVRQLAVPFKTDGPSLRQETGRATADAGAAP